MSLDTPVDYDIPLVTPVGWKEIEGSSVTLSASKRSPDGSLAANLNVLLYEGCEEACIFIDELYRPNPDCEDGEVIESDYNGGRAVHLVVSRDKAQTMLDEVAKAWESYAFSHAPPPREKP